MTVETTKATPPKINNDSPDNASLAAWSFASKYYYYFGNLPHMMHTFYGNESRMAIGFVGELLLLNIGGGAAQDAYDTFFEKFQYKKPRIYMHQIEGQQSINGCLLVHAAGVIVPETGQKARVFTQSFVLAPKNNDYYIINSILRFHLRELDVEGAVWKNYWDEDKSAPSDTEVNDVAMKPHYSTPEMKAVDAPFGSKDETPIDQFESVIEEALSQKKSSEKDKEKPLWDGKSQETVDTETMKPILSTPSATSNDWEPFSPQLETAQVTKKPSPKSRRHSTKDNKSSARQMSWASIVEKDRPQPVDTMIKNDEKENDKNCEVEWRPATDVLDSSNVLPPKQPKSDPQRNDEHWHSVFVGNLKEVTTADEIKSLFSKFGTVVDVHRLANKRTAFVRFESRESVLKVIETGVSLENGTRLKVDHRWQRRSQNRESHGGYRYTNNFRERETGFGRKNYRERR